MYIVLRELDKEKFRKNVIAWLDGDNVIQSCYTDFKYIITETITQMISEIVEKDDWNLQYFDEKESEKLFKAFMENSEITIRLIKQIDEVNYAFDEVIIEFDFSEIEKKEIAEIYLDNILNEYNYLDRCIIDSLEEIDIDLIAELLSDQIYQILTSDEIKKKFKDKLENVINLINDAEIEM